MSNKQALQVFEHYKVRTIWDEESQKWYFSVVDVCAALTDSKDPTAYWRKLKQRLKEEGNETVTNCHAFKLVANDGKKRLTTIELALNTLAEASTAAISRKEKPATLNANRQVARKGGNVAKIARANLEEQLGQSVVTSQKASDYLPQQRKMQELESKNEDNEQT